MMEWFNNNQQQHEQQMQVQMERQYQSAAVGVSWGLNVKVMTEEQIEILRKQISVYATICEQLVEMHNSFSTAGMRFANPYCDPLVASRGQKIPARHRWTPTLVQLQILEEIYEQVHGTPCKQSIKEITTALTKYGQITETNVYHWFQNRKARTKRKQLLQIQNNSESEMETEIEPRNEKKTKPESYQSVDNSVPKAENIFFSSSPDDHIGIDQLIGKMDLPESLSPYSQLDASNDSLLCLNRTFIANTYK